MADNRAEVDINMDTAALYREETFTDRRIGTIQRLTPIDLSGNPDTKRPVLYVGQTQVLTPAGSLPLSFEIPAQSLEEAAQKFGAQAEQALTSTMRRLDELRREAASSIIVPGATPPPGGLKMR
jgi:hypothetical protein